MAAHTAVLFVPIFVCGIMIGLLIPPVMRYFPGINGDVLTLPSAEKPWTTLRVGSLSTKMPSAKAVSGPAGSEVLHPLDPLTAAEISTVRSVLLDAGLIYPGSCAVRMITVYEPAKADVLSWQKGKELPPRWALAVLWNATGDVIQEVVVDVQAEKVIESSVTRRPGKPMISNCDSLAVMKVASSYPPLRAAAAKRGMKVEDVFCAPGSGGYYNATMDGNRRLVRANCFDMRVDNLFMQPLEGIVLYIDLDRKEVFHFDDHDPVPTAKPSSSDYRASKVNHENEPPLKPIEIEQPEGVSFIVEGHVITWQRWQLHVRSCAQAGLVISRVMFNDTFSSVLRDIMYQGHLSEFFVPYQDTSQGWFSRTYFDAGEYGFGLASVSLLSSIDCPKNAFFLPAVWADEEGNPVKLPNHICIFERYAGDVLWRHTETFKPGLNEIRRKVSLVVRHVGVVGNYDYTIEWEFQQEGVIRVTATMSGIVNVKAVYEKNLYEAKANGFQSTTSSSTTATTSSSSSSLSNSPANASSSNPGSASSVASRSLHGTFVDEHTVAVNHDHFLSFRLDMDVDGPANNSFVAAQLMRFRPEPNTSWRTSYWDVEEYSPLTETEAQFNVSVQKPAEFFIRNVAREGHLGNKVGYKLVPGLYGLSLLAPDDFPQKRAAWTRNSLWVTPFDRTELWASGTYPNQQPGNDNLATWTQRGRRVLDEDIVVWYTMGYHHVPVQEDVPVMPSVVGSFELKPANFFKANPSIRVPPGPIDALNAA